MADVSVEFGAQDVGLEKTLKQVQAEMQNLEGKVKSGELTMTELEQTMKRLGQVENLEKKLNAIGGESKQAGTAVDKLSTDIKGAGESAEKTGGLFDLSFAKIAAATAVGNVAAKAFTAVIDAGFAVAQKTVEGFSQALDLGGRLNDLSARTGESAGNLLVLQRAFENSGAGAEAVGGSINKLQKFMEGAATGGAEQAQTMNTLGLSYADLAGKTPTEQMQAFAQRITAIQDPTARAATAMQIFGKSGGELLPLLTNFAGEIDTAKGQLGSMTGIMDRQNGVFDSVSDKIKVISGKFMEFAAGILDKAVPALDAITEGLSRIDAAGIGQKLADAFLGGQNAMKGFQTAVDAFKAGNMMDALNLIFESTKLQAMETANQIYKNLTAAFETAGNVVRALFSQDSATMKFIEGSFKILGNQSAVAFGEAMLQIIPNIRMFDGIRKNFNENIENIKGAAYNNFKVLGGYATDAGNEIVDVLGQAPKIFEKNLASANGEFFNTQDQAAKVASLESDISAKVAEQNAKRVESNQLTAEQSKKINENVAAEQRKAELAAQANDLKKQALRDELAINQAKAAGDSELVKSLENQKLFNDQLKKAIDAGMGEPEAKKFAQAMLNAKNAADAIAGKDVQITVTTKVDDQRWKNLLSEINNAPTEKNIGIALQVTGAKNLSDARQTLLDMEQVNKNYQAAFTATGASSIEEVKNNLYGIPTEQQKDLVMRITGKDNYDQAVAALNSVQAMSNKEVQLELKKQGFETVEELKKQVTGFPTEKRTDLILKALGLEDVNSATTALEAIIANNGKSSSVNVSADTTDAETKINSLGGTAPVTASADTTAAKEDLNSLGGTASITPDLSKVQDALATLSPQTITLDASASIAAIREQLASPITIDATGAGGTGGGTSILEGLVSDIKTLMSALNDKLPTAALTA